MDIKDFAGWLTLSDRKPSTVRRHLVNLNYLKKNCPSLSSSHILDFLLTLKIDHKATYLNTLVCTAKVYGQFSGDQDLISLKEFKEIPFTKATMSDAEIESFLSLPKPSNVNPKHWNTWNLFFSIMAYCGMRPAEVANLTIKDVDFGRSVFSLEISKTEPRLVPIPPNLVTPLTDHLAGLQAQHLFASERGGNHNNEGKVFNSVDWGYNFHSRIKRLGIVRKNLTPYSLRHSLITRLLEEDVNIFKVMKIVGHSDIRTTEGYTHMTTKDIQLAIQKHPLIRKATDPCDRLRAIAEILKSFEMEKDTRFEYTLSEGTNTLKFEVRVKEEARIPVKGI